MDSRKVTRFFQRHGNGHEEGFKLIVKQSVCSKRCKLCSDDVRACRSNISRVEGISARACILQNPSCRPSDEGARRALSRNPPQKDTTLQRGEISQAAPTKLRPFGWTFSRQRYARGSQPPSLRASNAQMLSTWQRQAQVKARLSPRPCLTNFRCPVRSRRI